MTLYEVIKAEAKFIFSDVAIVLTILGGVILYSFLYPQPYVKESVSSLHVSVVDLDKSDVSRDIIYKLNATPQVDVIRQDMSKKDALEALEATLVKAVIIIPSHFKRDLALGKSTTIAVGADSSYFLIYGAVLEGAMKSVLTASVKIKITNLLKANIPLAEAKKAYTPYSINAINLFNKYNSYTEYVVPAVFILILQQTLLIGLGILGGSVNEHRRRKEDFYFREAKVYQLMLARYIIFGVLFFIHILFYFGFTYEFFGISHFANIVELLNLGLVFLVAVISFGLFLGALFTSRESATPVVLFSSLGLVFSAGFIWPIEAIPDSIRYLSYIAPSTPAIKGFLELNQMGANVTALLPIYAMLFVQIVVYTILGYYFINKNRKRYE